MAKTKKDNSPIGRHKLLTFEQPGDFYHRRALRHLDNEEYAKAIWHLKQAINKEPSNHEYRLDLAGVLSEIERFNDSNQELFLIMQASDELPAECYYGLGCNFYGLNEFDKAADSLHKYLEIDPDGTYAEDAQFMLDNIFSVQEATTNLTKEISEKEPQPNLHLIGKEGDSQHWIYEQTAKALILFIEGKLVEAKELSLEILQSAHEDFNALCMMALCCNRLHETDEAMDYAKRAEESAGGALNDLQKLAIVLCDMKLHDIVVSVLQRIRNMKPYNGQTLHYLALAYYNTGDYRAAAKVWETALQMNPDDLVTIWYLDQVRMKMKGEGPDTFDYIPQIPPNAINERINFINRMLGKYNGPSEELWEDEAFKRTVMWAAELPDTQIQRAMLHIVYNCGGKRTEEYFRARLLSKHDNDEVKRDVYAYLKRMDATEPYYAHTKHGIAEVRVSMIQVETGELPPYYRDVLELAIEKMEGEYSPYFAVRTIKLWTEYLRAKVSARHRIKNVSLWAATVECMYRYDTGQVLNMIDLSKRYDIDVTSLRKVWRRIKKYMDEERED